jgi:hypothetical protein
MRCNCCVKSGGLGKANTPYKKHLWDCVINDDYLYDCDWISAKKSIIIIEQWYINIKKKYINNIIKFSHVSELNETILSYLDHYDLGILYMLSKDYQNFIINFIKEKYNIYKYLNKYTCTCNICDKLYDKPMSLYPLQVNNKIILSCYWRKQRKLEIHTIN